MYMNKRNLMAIGLVASIFLTSSGAMAVYGQDTDNLADKYVTLDGDWHFMLYRTYSQMFQYFPYGGVSVTWEDNELAKLPDKETFMDWEVVQMPADDASTGGLLPIERTLTEESDISEEGQENVRDTQMFPSWSEAWVCREFTLTENFTEDDEVTLLLGIIDDMDVVYINGYLVAASGFVDGNGAYTQNIPETGGFDYDNPDSAQRVQFEKSYWEVAREYKVPTEYLNQNGSNEICIRIYNNNSYGGFYSGNNYAICGNDLAVRAVKGLPTDTVSSEELLTLVEYQNQQLEQGNIEAYAETIYDKYHNDGMDKEDHVREMQELITNYDDITIEDTDVSVYSEGENLYWYSAHRVISGVSAETETRNIISEEDVEICYLTENSQILERGNWNRCYSVTYNSALFDKELSYSIYLPPSYYEEENRMYPSVYLLHGINSSSESFVKVDGIADFMDEQISEGNITEMIIIMPDSGKSSFYQDTEYDPDNPDSTGLWQTHITTEIRNEAESNFRIIGESKFRGITGISMGGYGAFTIGTLFPDLYSSVASHMGAVNDNALKALQSLTLEQLNQYDFYLDCGLQDTMVDYQWTVNIHEYLQSVEKEHGYDLRDGGHNSAFYMSGMPASMKMHSDHFLKNGLFDAELQNQGGIFDLSESSENHKDVWIPVSLNGNIIESIEGLSEGTDFKIDEDGVTVYTQYLNNFSDDIILDIQLFSGVILSYPIEIVDSSDIDYSGQSETSDIGKGQQTEIQSTSESSAEPSSDKVSLDSVNTSDTLPYEVYAGLGIVAFGVLVLSLVIIRTRKASKK